MPTVTLYSYQQQMYWIVDSYNSINQAYPVTQYNQKLYKGVDNTLQLLIKTVDRRPVSLVGQSLIARVADAESGQIMITVPCEVWDDPAGKAKLTLSKSDIDYWPLGYYNIRITSCDTQGQETFLYADQNQVIDISLELFEGATQSLVPAIEIKGDHFTSIPVGWYDKTIWTTGALPAGAQTGDISGTATWSVYTTNWSGKFWVQGSLVSNQPSENDWFHISLSDTDKFKCWYWDDQPKLWTKSITENLYWIQFSFANDLNNRGTFDKILYKS